MKEYILKTLLGAVGPLLLSIISSFSDRKILDSALELAKVEVNRLMGDKSKTNDEKRAVAFERVKNGLIATGKGAKDSTINLALELAYSALKALTGK